MIELLKSHGGLSYVSSMLFFALNVLLLIAIVCHVVLVLFLDFGMIILLRLHVRTHVCKVTSPMVSVVLPLLFLIWLI